MARPRALAWALSFVSLASWTTTAGADWPVSPLANVPVCTAAGGQSVHALVGDGLGGVIAVWQDSRSGDDDIYAQRLSAAGVARWAPNGVSVSVAGGEQVYPQAVPDGAGGAIIVWEDFRNGGTSDVYAQRIDASGAMQWTPGGVALCTAAAFQLFPLVVSDGAGGAVVVWTDERMSGCRNFYAQRVGADGTPQWTADGVALTTAVVDQQPPAVTSDDSSGVIITWHAVTSGILHARAQRVDGSGTPRWGTNGVALANVGAQVDPRIAGDGAGGAIVAWADYRSGDGMTTTTYAQRVNAAGVSQWTANGVALATPSGDQQYQAVVPDGVGGVVVVWSDHTTTAIRAQRVNASGVLQWPLSGVPVCSGSGEHQVNRIQSDGAGGVLVPWSDYRVGGGDVYVQRVNAAGTPVWTIDGVATCTAPYVQAGPMLISDGSGGALVAWSDYRGGDNWHVYAQNIGAGGTLGGSTLGVVEGPPHAALAVSCAGANPHRGALAVECSLPDGGTAVVGLFDVSGRCLESRALPDLGAGTQHVAFSAAGARAPGVYLVRLVQGARSAAMRIVLVR